MNNKISEKTDLCQISLTGIRAIVLLGLLIEAPRSLKEIKQIYIDSKLMEDSGSEDVLRIDLNTLKAIGCEISRSSLSTNHKYVLTKHPFMMKFAKEEINLLKRAYNKNKANMNIETLIKYDELFKKLAKNVSDEQTRESIYGISSLKIFEQEIVKDLTRDCKEHKILKLIYKPAGKEKEERDIYAVKIMFQNEKLYLLGKDINSSQEVMLNIKRILKIISRSAADETMESNPTKIIFSLKNFGVNGILEEERIIEAKSDEYILEGNYHNEFIALQRIMSFGSSCTVIEPEDFKQKIIAKLKSIRKVYND